MVEAPNARIAIELEDILVAGEITARTRRFIAVRPIEPFGRLSASCTIPLFAAHRATFVGETRDATARQLLAETYQRAVLFDRHADVLRQRWRWTQRILLRLEAEDVDAPTLIAETRRDLRHRFRAGQFDNRELQQRLRPLNQRAKAFEMRRADLLSQFEASRPWRDSITLREVVYFLGEDASGLRDEDGLTRDRSALGRGRDRRQGTALPILES